LARLGNVSHRAAKKQRKSWLQLFDFSERPAKLVSPVSQVDLGGRSELVKIEGFSRIANFGVKKVLLAVFLTVDYQLH
jgi:hypothetical protein